MTVRRALAWLLVPATAVATAFAALWTAGVILMVRDRHNGDAAAIAIGVIPWLIAIGVGIAARIALRPAPPPSAAGEWIGCDGEVFARPKAAIAILLLLSPLILLFAAFAYLALVVGIGWLVEGAWDKNPVATVAFGLCFGPAMTCVGIVAAKGWRRWNVPLAIVGRDTFTMPLAVPERVRWRDVKSIRAYSFGRTALLDLELVDPVAVFGRRRGWWHGPWRDRVTLGIGNVTHPLVRAVREAHRTAIARD